MAHLAVAATRWRYLRSLAAMLVLAALASLRLGQSSLAYLMKDARLQPSRVMPAHRRVRIHLRSHLRIAGAPQIDINAVALPDGSIVVTDQLIWSLTTTAAPEQDAELALTGTLAHEIGQVEARDAVRGLVGGSLMQTLPNAR